MPNARIHEWFDELDKMLRAEMAISGLLDHAATTGQAREFLVRRILESVMPTGVVFSSGKIIDSFGGVSRQIDLILYDPRFPQLKVAGGGLYLAEGVLATIEVKSAIDSRELVASLNNCESVLRLGLHGDHGNQADERVAWHMQKAGLLREQAQQRFDYRIRPATYVFGFRSSMSVASTTKTVSDWWAERGCANGPYYPMLPRLIVCGDTVGITDDGRLAIQRENMKRGVMAVFSTAVRFRWFALHILDAVSSRLGLRHSAEKFDYRIQDYFDFQAYAESLRDSDMSFIESVTPPSGAPTGSD